MLKIRDDKWDEFTQIFEKFGFVKDESDLGCWYISCHWSSPNININIMDHFIIFQEGWWDSGDFGQIDKLYDLSQAGFIEKVDDKELD